MRRRECLKWGVGAVALAGVPPTWAKSRRPNVILMMADDLGYGDTGFSGNPIIQTPHLDAMAQAGANLTRFYAGGPVCSPTRGTCLTGRHYFRYGINSANKGHLPKEEITLARMLKSKGYRTGHFGKWHLGTLSKTVSPKGRKRKPELNYAPPWERDYDRSFAVESAVGTWDPGYGKRAKNNPFYEDGTPTMENLKGGAARVVMDRVVPFVRNAVAAEEPFLAVVWFNAPHEDIMAGPDYVERYAEHGEAAAHYYGCITELDEQVGRLRAELKELGIADNTVVWFASDNGPEGKIQGQRRRYGSSGGLRGRKRALFEGGVRVPSLVEWPGQVRPGSTIDVPLSTLDYFPTLQRLCGYRMPDARPIDGVDMTEIVAGQQNQRGKAIPFRFDARRFESPALALIDENMKLCTNLADEGDLLFDLSKDPAEKHNLANQYPERVERMRKQLAEFVASTKRSHSGADYSNPDFKPVERWAPVPPPKRAKEQ